MFLILVYEITLSEFELLSQELHLINEKRREFEKKTTTKFCLFYKYAAIVIF